MGKQAANGHDTTPELSNQLGQLRDILFGEDKKEFEAHFKDIEQKNSIQIEQLNAFINQELTNLKTDMDKQFDLLTNQLNDFDHLHNEREDQLQGFAESTAQQLASFEKSVAQSSKTLQEKLASDADKLNEHLEQQFSSLTDKIDQIAASLEHNKADRSLLAEVLVQAAEKISSQGADSAAEQNSKA
ncbi:hypothetical protein HII17_04225 [Thalassotalea sp. M1531]|uniref:Uncharacterized protein n=1 Tax=Thalassotalea algicola TaxID=2716224 RepID=A0A7Y0LAB4_9GAMM|nr:hypothetical protein [Thalassotalea algicola]NMP30761.1 hypothetical protein [Thalassotalea algicola]